MMNTKPMSHGRYLLGDVGVAVSAARDRARPGGAGPPRFGVRRFSAALPGPAERGTGRLSMQSIQSIQSIPPPHGLTPTHTDERPPRDGEAREPNTAVRKAALKRRTPKRGGPAPPTPAAPCRDVARRELTNHAVAWLLALVGCLGLTGVTAGAAAGDRSTLERELRRHRKVLLAVDYPLGEHVAARSLRLAPAVLQRHQLYLRNQANSDYVQLAADGTVVRNGRQVARLTTDAELLLTAGAFALFVDGQVIPLAEGAARDDWRWYWIADDPVRPVLTETRYPSLAFADGFMRTALEDEHWKVISGEWRMKQHGGGMPTTEAQEQDYNFQRAVNPFTVTGQGNGALRWLGEPIVHGRVEARFYFGKPKDSVVVDINALPTETSMLVAIGQVEGGLAAFGWRGATQRFALLWRDQPGAWQVLREYQGPRPPVTNWVKLGLELRQGHLLVGLLDDVAAVTATLPRRHEGAFYILGGTQPLELDDARAWSLPLPEGPGAPLYVKSRQFANKRAKGQADPMEFSRWARSANTFLRATRYAADGQIRDEITCRLPLFGDFRYESVPADAEAGALPTGLYEFAVLGFQAARDVAGAAATPNAAAPASRPAPGPAAPAELLRLRCQRDADGWRLLGVPPEVWPPDYREFTLRLERRAALGNRLTVRRGTEDVALSAEPVTGPVRLSIGRIFAPGQPTQPPVPEHHTIYSAHLVNEFFEEAPTDWNWVEGAFRMDIRWACQNQWNFMACSSLGAPFMASKRRYTGDQEFEYFTTIRPVFPWDAGDATWQYTGDLGGNFGWYTRRDLNFAFCSDGRNPLSGYAVVFAGDDNSHTFLLRQGQTVADTKVGLMPQDGNFGIVHWMWWNFHVTRYGNRISVQVGDRELLSYTDPEPLPGGHIGFWSIRNGFVISRVTASAEQCDWDPHFLYLDDRPAVPTTWRPLLRDTFEVTPQPGACATRFTFTTGAGFHAVRWTAPKPVDLGQTPVLRLPLQLGPGVRANLFVEIGGRAYLLRLTAPTGRTKELLTPLLENHGLERFRIPDLEPETLTRLDLGQYPLRDGYLTVNLAEAFHKLPSRPAEMLLASLTIGNTSNEDYLLAGHGGNAAGSSYALGEPQFVNAEAAAKNGP